MDREREHNRKCWDALVDQGNEWTRPVDSDTIAAARRGELNLLLTPCKPVPAEWYPPLKDTPTLCLATGGGQQAPALAAAGAVVTTLDNSPKQLEQDDFVAKREGLVDRNGAWRHGRLVDVRGRSVRLDLPRLQQLFLQGYRTRVARIVSRS